MNILERGDILGRHRQPLPEVPLFLLSRQQRMVYSLSRRYTTREIAQILSVPEKQVRQVYSAIRSKSREFANKNVFPATGAEPAHCGPGAGGTNSCNYDFIRELVENNGIINLTAPELFVMEQLNRGVSVRGISKLTGKSIQSIRKAQKRVERKICQNNNYYDDNCITKIDTGNTYVRIKFSIIRSAMERLNLSADRLCRETGIPVQRMAEIESSGIASFNELFLFIKHLKINPYGPTEKDRLLKKLSDPNWIRVVREGSAGGRQSAFKRREKIGRDKSRYRRIMYYGTAYFRHNSPNLGRPVVEEGRNGFFPVALTRAQQAECGWFLKKFMLKPFYTYRYPGIGTEIDRLEKRLAGEKDRLKADRYRREILHLKEDMVPENGRSIFILNKHQFAAIQKILFESEVHQRNGR